MKPEQANLEQARPKQANPEQANPEQANPEQARAGQAVLPGLPAGSSKAASPSKMGSRAAVAAALALMCAGLAEASVVTIQTNYSAAGPLGSPEEYVSVVQAALAAPAVAGYGTAVLPVFLAGNAELFGSQVNVAYAFTVEFEVTAAMAGEWSIRGGVDFGRGGVMMLDDTLLDYGNTDLWWGEVWAPNGTLTGTIDLQPGTHYLRLYGLDGCCAGVQTAQFSHGQQGWTTFGAADGLQPVPEPAAVTMLLAGGAALAGWAARRRRTG